MHFQRLRIPDLILVTPTKHGDHRGFFSETHRGDIFGLNGVEVSFVQDNHVFSAQRGVLRGLHFQLPPHPQGKLVRCTRGSILDVVVDIREGSPTFGEHAAVELSAENWCQFWVPRGFAHGYVTLGDDCEVTYRVTDYYSPECERGIAWDDPALAIDWRLPATDLVLSEKDRKQPRLTDAPTLFKL